MAHTFHLKSILRHPLYLNRLGQHTMAVKPCVQPRLRSVCVVDAAVGTQLCGTALNSQVVERACARRFFPVPRHPRIRHPPSSRCGSNTPPHHISVFLFFVCLVLFFSSTHKAITTVLSISVGLLGMANITFTLTIFPCIYRNCPYLIPMIGIS